ncbi:PspC domain-containing protein [Paenibacillus albicereus]|uniref:PspC domain-containing protein n=1 Tax=Paenibacillus albicereus TaxID=2726185 RepID=A0A6H2GT03_9BACL|nr:PspC domain-containing protein [Paenibacillus albicereus]QJC50554.1 PspC domain-containing protein [Paenibacillus albicereus]
MKTLYRSRTDRKIAGLCGGIGRTYGIDTGLVRIGFIAVGVFSGGTGLLLYAAASVVLPKEPEWNGPPSREPFYN